MFFILVLVSVIWLSVFGASGKALAFSPEVFINEIHYDNTGTDTGEAVEIAGPAGTELSGWSLVLYNGNGGVVYNTATLSGIIPDLGNGFGVVVVDYPTNGIQNGSPDGLALVDSVNNVIQFLSYEGSFAAIDGPANGMTSVDIGVDETSDTPIGFSLQLSGIGSTYDDFTWSPIAANTFNDFNNSQTFVSELPPTVVINEIDYDQPSTDTAEFIELKNVDTSAVDLSQFTLELVNGNGTTVYQTIPLPDVILAAGDYFVVCANAATVANCDLDVDPDTNLVQNGAPDAVGLRFNGTLIDAVSYEGDTGAPYTEGSGVGLEDDPAEAEKGISRCVDGTDTNQNNADLKFTGITPGAANECLIEACGDAFTPIYTIQGSGLASPIDGNVLATEGVVVGDFQDGKGGFFIQDPTGDSDIATSDGIFVYSTSLDVNVGDRVRVRGTVDEYFDLTEITNVSQVWLCSTGNSVTPTEINLPVSSIDDFESYEGMLVKLTQQLYISEYFNFDRFGEVVLTTEHQFQPTAIFEPGSPEVAQLAQENQLSRITLDDGRSTQNPDPAIHPNGSVFDLTNLFRGGDILYDVTGTLDFNFGLYKIQPTQGAGYIPNNPRPIQPDDVGGGLKVVSFNVLNYFTTIDNGVPICGPSGDQECRGADTALEFERQRNKIISALAAMSADVVGLIEIENHPGDIPTENLVDGLNAVMGAGTYNYIPTGAIGTDAIRVAIIYKPASITPHGVYAILDSSVDSRFLDDYNRPVLAQTFQDNTTGGIITVAVNHLKSKGSSCDAIGDPDTGDGSGNCNLTRKSAAEALVDWLASDPTGSGDADFLIIGDLNSYDKEDPIDAIKAGTDDVRGSADDYTDLLLRFQGDFAYSYLFDGQYGYLDHALSSASLTAQVAGAATWHINADEPDILDYDTTFKLPPQQALYEPNAYRSSDHDPVIVGLNLESASVCECDLTKDGKCNILDYQKFIQDWGRTNCGTPPGSGNPPNDCECDLKTDGKCNILDYQIFIQDWGRTDCPVGP